ncbi:hypothetical protein HYQ45_011571 [Verticillium longisporum]|uniref:Phosphoribosylaminoimidazole-succinocarboxamide synthase n=1 Tax=Verticillium longisporum TaxID=100787 RepID=A0A8I2ZE62_VERLO|nr:hypothetical protein VdG1_07199 [Verticillium dahliae VDG1]KAG7129150.1 hypothetical protein HYQ45_011571 [Verticillium longisporum]RBQ85618.1 hypothetical protein VDGD_01711 [Verticillium dahliae]
MNFQDLTFNFIDRQRPQPPQFWSPKTPSEQSEATIRPHGDTSRGGDDLTSDSGQVSLSPQAPAIFHAPSPPGHSDSDSTITESYGPSRLFAQFGNPLRDIRRHPDEPLIDNRPDPRPPRRIDSESTVHIQSQTTVRFNEAQLAMDEVANRARAKGFRDDMTLAVNGSITPGVDDGPFINYALGALTQQSWPRHSATSDATATTRGDAGAPWEKELPNDHDEYSDDDYAIPKRRSSKARSLVPSLAPVPSVYTRNSVRHSALSQSQDENEELGVTPIRLEAYNTTRPLSQPRSTTSSRFIGEDEPKQLGSNRWIPISEVHPTRREGLPKLDIIDPLRINYPEITYVPRILRLPSMITMMALCIIMIVLLVTSAILTTIRPGLLTLRYAVDDINHGQYFLFRVLPQLLAAVVFVYAQCIMTTTIRILPFQRMTNDESEKRRDALFDDLYLTNFMKPHLTGPPMLKACMAMIWLGALTIPLLSSCFAVARVDDQWTWSAVQGVAYTAVVLYVLLLGAIATLAMYWHKRITGLLWDPRSIADVAHMMYKSNTLDDYERTEMIRDRKAMQSILCNRRVDRLGYWQMEGPDVTPWYGIGIDTHISDRRGRNDVEDMPQDDIRQRESMNSLTMSLVSGVDDKIRKQYLPWFLRDGQMIGFAVISTLLLVALIVVSFTQGASWMRGFRPGHLSVYPAEGNFSAANFLFSFIPSLLGVLLYLFLQSLDMSLRTTQPWAELNSALGSPAGRSMLLDYAACHPFQATLHAARNKHWRVAAVSLMSTLAVFIPILAGGLFMARNIEGINDSRMRPNRAVFFIVLALLILYWFALMSLVPCRFSHRLPHSVTCLADLVSFLCTEDVREEKGFQFPEAKDRETMLTKLGLGKRWEESRWYFGNVPGKDEKLGVRRLKKYTERKARRH